MRNKEEPPISKEDKFIDERIKEILLEGMEVTDINSLFEKSRALKCALKPQTLLNYQGEREVSKMCRDLYYKLQNYDMIRELEAKAKEKERIGKQRMKLLKYLYRK